MVNQNIQQIRPELVQFRERKRRAVYGLQGGARTSLEDIGADLATLEGGGQGRLIAPGLLLRGEEEAHGRMSRAAPALEPFPKVGECLCDTKEVVNFMKKEMEEKYGGAHEATDLIYKSPPRSSRASQARGPVHAR